MHLQTALNEYSGKVQQFICQQDGDVDMTLHPHGRYGVFIGPEGGWSDAEKEIFSVQKLTQLHISNFTLRAETAAIAAVTKLM